MSEIDLLIQELRDTIDNQREEIDRLNNIINELEKYLEKIIVDSKAGSSMYYNYLDIYKYLKELKENK